MSKQELVTTKVPAFELDTPKIQLDAKIRTDDLLDAVIFEKEDELEKLSETTYKEYEKHDKIKNSIYKELEKLLQDFSKKYKPKGGQSLLKELIAFTGNNTFEVTFDCVMPKLKCVSQYGDNEDYDDEDEDDDNYNKSEDKIAINISVGNRYNCFEKTDYIKPPTNMSVKIKSYNDEVKTLAKLNKVRSEISKQKQKLVHIKKRIKASFIKTLIKGPIKDNAELLNSLRDELDLQIKK